MNRLDDRLDDRLDQGTTGEWEFTISYELYSVHTIGIGKNYAQALRGASCNYPIIEEQPIEISGRLTGAYND